MTFFDQCPLSHEKSKECVFAKKSGDDVKCAAVMGWWEDLSIKNFDKCFVKMKSRDKLAFRNRMIKKNF
tara:strand:- start:103 stop:309 length:207 start_codon:yes stop_codon:yes gene_type:complete